MSPTCVGNLPLIDVLGPCVVCGSPTSQTPTCRVATGSSPRSGRLVDGAGGAGPPVASPSCRAIPTRPSGRACCGCGPCPAASPSCACRPGCCAGPRPARWPRSPRSTPTWCTSTRPAPVGLLGVLAARRLGRAAGADVPHRPARLCPGVPVPGSGAAGRAFGSTPAASACRGRRCAPTRPPRSAGGRPRTPGAGGPPSTAPTCCCSATPTPWSSRPGPCWSGSACRCPTRPIHLVPTGVGRAADLAGGGGRCSGRSYGLDADRPGGALRRPGQPGEGGRPAAGRVRAVGGRVPAGPAGPGRRRLRAALVHRSAAGHVAGGGGTGSS